jgi:hypothetical protein
MPNEPTRANCCLPGDITVTKIHTGYLLGRALEQQGPGPWWTYVATASTRESAIQLAKDLAARSGGKAWLHDSGDDYDPLPDE